MNPLDQLHEIQERVNHQILSQNLSAHTLVDVCQALDEVVRIARNAVQLTLDAGIRGIPDYDPHGRICVYPANIGAPHGEFPETEKMEALVGKQVSVIATKNAP